MRTRRASYPSPSDGITFLIRPKCPYKRRKLSCGPSSCPSPSSSSYPCSSSSAASLPSYAPLDALHDELLISIMVCLSSTASSPADLISAMLASKKLCAAGTHKLVLAHASICMFALKAKGWSDGAHQFLIRCAQAGNKEAAYTLGMIRFYCFHEREAGASLMAEAAISSHAAALHSMAIIQFNGSGGTRKDKNLKNGASLCAKAAALGHVDAMRELGHCLQDGYGVPKNVPEGRRLLLEANAREAAAAVAASPRAFVQTALQLVQSNGGRCLHHHMHYRSALTKLEAAAQRGAVVLGASYQLGPNNEVLPLQQHPVYRLLHGGACSLLSDFGCNVPPAKLHVANKFLVEWFALHPPALGLRLCSHANCGRPETRRHEFRRCSACGAVNYCSRACQALDWKLRHKYDCSPVVDWEDRDDDNAAADGNQQAADEDEEEDDGEGDGDEDGDGDENNGGNEDGDAGAGAQGT